MCASCQEAVGCRHACGRGTCELTQLCGGSEYTPVVILDKGALAGFRLARGQDSGSSSEEGSSGFETSTHRHNVLIRRPCTLFLPLSRGQQGNHGTPARSLCGDSINLHGRDRWTMVTPFPSGWPMSELFINWNVNGKRRANLFVA